VVYVVSAKHRAAVDEILTSMRPPHSVVSSGEKQNRNSAVDVGTEGSGQNSDGVMKGGHVPPASVHSTHANMSHAPTERSAAYKPENQPQTSSSHARTTHTGVPVPYSNNSDTDRSTYHNNNNTSSSVPPWRSHALIFDTSALSKSGVPHTTVVQNEGEILVHFPHAYHSGVCQGFACWETVAVPFVSSEPAHDADARMLSSLHVKVRVCMYVCMYVYVVYVCVCREPAHDTDARMLSSLHVKVRVCMYVCMYVCVVYVCVCR
jgi:hypothetical protein